MNKDKPKFRIIEKESKEVKSLYEYYKEYYLNRLDLNILEISEELNISLTTCRRFNKRIIKETGLKRSGYPVKLLPKNH